MHENRRIWPLFIIIFMNVAIYATDGQIERIKYPVPLIKLSLMNGKTSVRVFKPNSDEYAIISLIDDEYVKSNHDKTFRTTYKEYKHRAHYLSPFEIKYLLLATKSLQETIESFEQLLQKERWGQCAYLDSYLPKFLHNFYILIAVARNSPNRYREQVALFEKQYEISLNSTLSDERIIAWQNDSDCLVKLRIASKELVHQLSLWKKRELCNKKRNPEVVLDAKVEESLDLFIRIYFCIKTPQKRYTTRNNRK